MAEFFFDYGLFVAKLGTIVIAVVVVILISVVAGRRVQKSKGHIEVTKINDELEAMRNTLHATVTDLDTFKLFIKQEKQTKKLERKARKKALKQAAEADAAAAKSRLFVLDFDGDLRASAVACLRREITAVLSLARANDEVVVRVESRGGMVHAYGLASSQLQRVKQHGIGLTVCVDKAAASGGYMMACVANKILAAPFAMLGSIGVVAQIPNFSRLLKKHDIDFELITAGEYKRTLTMLAPNTRKGREKFVEDIQDIHSLFKEFVAQHRPQLDIEQVATGEVWFGERALNVALVDDLITSDEYINRACDQSDVFEVKYVERKSLQEKLGFVFEAAADRLLMRWWDRLTQSHNYF